MDLPKLKLLLSFAIGSQVSFVFMIFTNNPWHCLLTHI